MIEPVPTNVRNIKNHIIKTTLVEHPVCSSETYIARCKSSIIEEIKRTPTRPVLQIYEDFVSSIRSVIESLEDEFVLNNFDVGMPPSSTFLRTMYRARREVIPPNPPSQSEIDVSGDIMYLNDCSIVHGDDQGLGENDRILLFSTKTLIHVAGNISRFDIDCPFKVSPMTYNQTFVLFGFVSTCVWVPIYIAVLPNKTEATYERLYNLIDMSMAAEQISYRLDTEVMFDFEAAQRNAWSRLHPSHRLRGCLFHYTQVVNFCIIN